MKKGFLKILSLLLCVATLFGVCGCVPAGDDSGGGDNTIVIAYKQETAEALLTRKMINAFKAKKAAEGVNVTVKMFEINLGSYNSEILKQNASNTMADVYHTDDSLAPVWAEKGLFENLDPYFERDNFDFSLYDEMAFNAAKVYNDSVYFAPRTYDQAVVILNLDFFNEYGVTAPTAEEWNWTKLVETCAALRTAINAKETPLVAENYFPMDACVSWQPIYSTFVKAFGGYIVDPATDTIGLTESGAVAAFEKIDYLLDEKYFNDPNSPSAYFPNKKAGMYIMSRPTCANFEANGLTNVAFLPFPVFDAEFTGLSEDKGIMPYGSAGYALCSKSKNKGLAWEFIKFTMSEDGQNIMGENGTNVPIIKSLQTDPDASWIKGIDILKDLDQSAFVFGAEYEEIYERVLGNFGKGIAPEKESTLYTTLKQQINSINSATYKDRSIEYFCSETEKALKTALGWR